MNDRGAVGRLTMTHPVGVKVTFEFTAASSTDLLKGVDKFVSTLVDRGWTVPLATPTATQDRSAPLCPIHNKPMKPSQHGGWFCPVKIAEDDGSGKPVYCKATG